MKNPFTCRPLVGARELRGPASLPTLVAALLLTLLCGSLSGCASAPAVTDQATATPRAGSDEASELAPAEPATRTVTILAMNDVYRIGAVDGGAHGGLSRLRTLRAEMEQDAPELLVLHAGDLLSPALLSSTFFGAQMIDVLNLLDGDAEAFDERMFLTFGNHEFDRGKLDQAVQLDMRLGESEFRWVSSNVDFKTGDDGEPLIEDPDLVDLWLTESAGVKVGLFGLTVNFQEAEYIAAYRDSVETARNATAELRRRGAELVIGLTHQTATQDANLMETLGDDGPDLIVGGHEHDRLARCVDGTLEDLADGWQRCTDGRSVVKADADARTVAIWEIDVPADGGRPEARYRWQSLGPDEPARDPMVEEVVADWNRWFDEIFCSQQNPSEPAGCLETRVGTTQTELYAEELDIRRFETNFGSWLADQTMAAWAQLAANDPSIPEPQLAFVNSGSIRLNQNVPPGPLRRRQIEELFPFPTTLALFRTTGAQLQEIVDHSISQWEGAGHFLQISGFAFHHHTESGSADGLTFLGPNGSERVEPDDEFVVATLDFLVNPSGNQDGYTMIKPDQVLHFDVRADLRTQVLDALEAAGDPGIAPQFEGRICTLGSPHGMPEPMQSMPCLARDPAF